MMMAHDTSDDKPRQAKGDSQEGNRKPRQVLKAFARKRADDYSRKG